MSYLLHTSDTHHTRNSKRLIAGIMGGDTPLDFKDEFYGICDVEEFGDKERNLIPVETFMENLPQILDYIEKSFDCIGWQVLGVMMMEIGAPISDELKEKITQAATEDEWAEEDEERMEVMTKFKATLKGYTGTPTVIRTPGLFETIANHLEAGKEGLVNKDFVG